MRPFYLFRSRFLTFFLCATWSLFFQSPIHADHSVVTYEFSGGRFGDNLLSYLHAKWFSYEKNLPFLYKPFPYSESLALHDLEIHFRNRKLRKKLHLSPTFKVSSKSWNIFSKVPFFSFCYVCPYFPEDKIEIEEGKFYSFEVDWKNPAFRNMLKKMIRPKNDLNIVKPPKNIISVALHIRDGGGFDQGAYRLEIPLKFPPLSFYIDGLKQVLETYPNKKIYCHIFTDAINPKQILDQIQKNLPLDAPIDFNYRKETNSHDQNVLEDFFSLFEFDILIRPQSNFSVIPSLIKDYALVYSPKKFSSDLSQIYITEACIETNQEQYLRLLQ